MRPASRGTVKLIALAAAFLLVCSFEPGADASSVESKPFHEHWTTFKVGKLGWQGIGQDARLQPHRTNELLSFSSIYVFPSPRKGRYWVTYSPAPGDFEDYRNSALRLAAIDGEDGKVDVSSQQVETRSFFGKTSERGYVTGIPMDVSQKGDSVRIWYIHPFRRNLVRYNPRQDARKTWDLSEKLPLYNQSWHWGVHWLNMLADREEPVVHMSAYKRRAHYLAYNTDKGRFVNEEEVGIPATTWIMRTADGVRVFSKGYFRFLRFHRVEGEPQHTAPGAGETQWEMTALCPQPLSHREVTFFTDTEQRVHGLYTDDSDRIYHFERDGKLWRVEKVARLESPDEQTKYMPQHTLSTSAMVSPEGVIHVSCYAPAKGLILHLWRKGDTWYREEVASAEHVYSTSLLHDGNSLVIAWNEVGKRLIKAVARAAAEGAYADGHPIEPVPPMHYLPEGGRDVTSLHDEARSGNVDAMRRMLEMGVRADGRTRKGLTALHAAVLQGQRDAAELLLSEGCPVDARDGKGRTPLHAAAAAGRPQIARLLLAKGAHPEAEADGGLTPLDMARKGKNQEMVKVLQNAGGA